MGRLSELSLEKHPPFHAVAGVMPVPPSHLLLLFDTGEYKLADLGDLLLQDGPLFLPLRRWDFLRLVRQDQDGVTVVWPNGLDLDPAMLYAAGTPVSLDAAVLPAACDHRQRLPAPALANAVGGVAGATDGSGWRSSV